MLNTSEVVQFLVTSGALKFGDFTLKSGRIAPYFINTGSFDDGEKIAKLGSFYASKIISLALPKTDVVFGPAYKGIPLCVTTAAALSTLHNINLGFTFNRKEAKTHGDGGEFVGTQLKPGMRVVLVEDVVTAGTTLQEMVPLLRDRLGVEVQAVVILVDRRERGSRDVSAVEEAESDLKIKVHPIVTIDQIIQTLSALNISGFQISPELFEKILAYRKEYGV